MRGNSELVFVMCAVGAVASRSCTDRIRYQDQKAILRAEIEYKDQVEKALLMEIQDLKAQVADSLMCRMENAENLDGNLNVCREIE